ncbi:gluconolactonase [Formosa algae]|nr:gluconolactonase [Formosa algae]
MKHYILIIGLLFLLFSCNQSKSEGTTHQDNFTQEKKESPVVFKLEKLASGFHWGEGPASDEEGNIYFTDVHQSKILVWTTDEELEVFRENSNGANGLFFDKNGNLITCEMQSGQITSTSNLGEYKVIASTYNGVSFNEPNDLWLDDKGGIYFTDPKYGRHANELSQDGMHVYYISSDHKKVTRVIDDLEKPNGLVGTSDGKILYVTDAQGGKTYRYDIQEDGSLQNKTLFVEFGCDGMTIDQEGNVYLSTNGRDAVDIFSPSGTLLNSIPVSERVANMCFSKKDNTLLYITGKSSLYRVKIDGVFHP